MPHHILPFKIKKNGGQARYIKDKEAICLMNDQARHVYKMIGSGSVINVDTIKQEIDQTVDEIDETNGEINSYHKIIVNKAERDNTIISQMKKWSILSNVVNYIQYTRYPKNFYNFDIRATDQIYIINIQFPISKQGYRIGKLLDGTECQILLDTGASKSFMSK